MNEKIMVLLLLSILTVLLAGKKADDNAKNTEWKRIKSRRGITTSSIWITSEDNSRFKVTKAETCIHVPKDKLLEIIQSGIYTSEWMSMVDNCYVKKGISQNQWVSEVTLKLFWPFSNNNLEIDYSLLNEDENSTIIMFQSKTASLLNKRVKSKAYQFRGTWELVPEINGTTKVILKIRWDKSNALHYLYISPIISEGIFNSLRKLKKLSEEKYKTESIFLAATAL